MSRGPLRRSRSNRLIAGVCGGFAKHFGLDPTLVRVLWVLLFGIGIFAYLLLWALIPEEGVPPAGTV